MTATMTASEARAALPHILDVVEGGEMVTITRHGRPIAIVISPDAFRHRRPAATAAIARADELGREMEALRGQPLSDMPGISNERAEELVRQIRADRDAE